MAAHLNIRASILKFLNEQIVAMKAASILVASAELFDWDSHAQQNELPENDLVGTANLSWTNEGQIFSVDVMIGISTFHDKNMFRHHQVVDYLTSRLRPAVDAIPMFDAALGGALKFSLLVQDPLEVTPVLKTKTRSVQFIQLALGSGTQLSTASP